MPLISPPMEVESCHPVCLGTLRIDKNMLNSAPSKKFYLQRRSWSIALGALPDLVVQGLIDLATQPIVVYLIF
uniref:Uncharacterized protein n=1 Tax=Rhizophora mucronata TaxID=61149 RepID=A0A2P2J866_RHIMU